MHTASVWASLPEGCLLPPVKILRPGIMESTVAREAQLEMAAKMLAQNVYGFLHSVTHTAAQLNASLAGTQAGERVFRPNAAATAAAPCAGD